MRTHARRVVAAVALVVAAGLLAAPGAAGDKGKAWKQFLPADAYQELFTRAAKNVEEALKGSPTEEAIKKAKFNAIMLAAYTMSAKDAPVLPGTRLEALKLAKLIGEKGKLESARNLAAGLASGKAKVDEGAKEGFDNPKAYLEDLDDVMEHFKVVKKGGDGIHPDLQSNMRLKGALNGIEEKLRALSMKKLTEARATKEAGELALLGYRAAVVGEVTYFYTPKKKAEEWRELALAMRDAGVGLAEAAKSKDADAVFKAADRLNSSCSQCHSGFRKKP